MARHAGSTVSAIYKPGVGTIIAVSGPRDGVSVLLHEHMTVSAIESYVRELREWLS